RFPELDLERTAGRRRVEGLGEAEGLERGLGVAGVEPGLAEHQEGGGSAAVVGIVGHKALEDAAREGMKAVGERVRADQPQGPLLVEGERGESRCDEQEKCDERREDVPSALHDDAFIVARYPPRTVRLCAFDLDHTLVRTPLDLAAMALDMRSCL